MLQPKSFYRASLVNKELEIFERSLMGVSMFGGNPPNLDICLRRVNRLLKEENLKKLKVSEIEEINQNYKNFLNNLPKSSITQEELDRYNRIRKPLDDFLNKRITFGEFIKLTKTDED